MSYKPDPCLNGQLNGQKRIAEFKSQSNLRGEHFATKNSSTVLRWVGRMAIQYQAGPAATDLNIFLTWKSYIYTVNPFPVRVPLNLSRGKRGFAMEQKIQERFRESTS